MNCSVVPCDYTPVPFERTFAPIRLKAAGVSMGSCFADRVFSELYRLGVIRGMRNSNGILYNPYSIQEALRRLDVGYTESDFFEFNGLWHSWMHHGSFSAPTLGEALEKAERVRKDYLRALRKAEFFLLTLSSPWVWIRNEDDRIVANCHKVPATEFHREILSHDTCRAAVVSILRRVREVNPDCRFIATVSPVKTDPGDLRKNALAKGRLRSALEEALTGQENTAYYPAYEIVTEELRDYRYYAADRIHPSDEAYTIILERFLEQCFSSEAVSFYEDARRQEKAALHRANRN